MLLNSILIGFLKLLVFCSLSGLCEWDKVNLQMFSIFWVHSKSSLVLLLLFSNSKFGFATYLWKIKYKCFILMWIFLYINSYRSEHFQSIVISRGTYRAFISMHPLHYMSIVPKSFCNSYIAYHTWLLSLLLMSIMTLLS